MLKFTLLENAYDYILDAVIKLEGDPDKRAIKYAIIHLRAGIELLLKKRLMDEHWSLIFRDVNKANKSDLESGNFVSVYFDELVQRLHRICNVDITKFKDILVKVREDGNRLEHFQIETSKTIAISKLIKTWDFVLDFSLSQISSDREPEAIALLDNIRSKIVAHEDFIKERWDEILPEIQKNKEEEFSYTVIECPVCLQEAMFLLGGSCECKFCRYRSPWEETMDKWLTLYEGLNYSSPKELSAAPPLTLQCPSCGMDALYQFKDVDIHSPDPGWICFHCGGRWALDEIDTCVRCDRLYFVSSKDDTCCGQCWPDD